jgi:hypothetical protein
MKNRHRISQVVSKALSAHGGPAQDIDARTPLPAAVVMGALCKAMISAQTMHASRKPMTM